MIDDWGKRVAYYNLVSATRINFNETWMRIDSRISTDFIMLKQMCERGKQARKSTSTASESIGVWAIRTRTSIA